MDLSAEGEFGLIGHLRSRLAQTHERIRVGIGDDTAVIRSRPGHELLLTTDTLVESIHFDLSYTPPESLGWKALAVNLSDVAAMGGRPVCAVISLAVPAAWPAERIDRLYDGLIECSRAYDCPITGGDTVRTPGESTITVTVLGDVGEGAAVLRSGARAGDVLCVTGSLGRSRTGLEILMTGHTDMGCQEAITHFLRPVPRIEAAGKLAKTGGVTSMIDISDSLTSEIRHLCRESTAGCLLEADRIPIAPDAFAWASVTNRSPVSLAMESGEEYELLFTLTPEIYRQLYAGTALFDGLFAKIGEMRDEAAGMRMVSGGIMSDLPEQGWDHFKS